jgi:exopolysaccharide biosynthesis polyprenyl glycosylphosphotransferase
MTTTTKGTMVKSLFNQKLQHNYRLALPFSERRLLLIIGDITNLLAAAIFVLYMVRTPAQSILDMTLIQGVWLAIVAVIWFVLSVINGCYNLTISSRPFPLLLRFIFVTVGTIAIYILLFFFLSRPIAEDTFLSNQIFGHELPRILPIFFVLTAFLFVGIWRGVYLSLFTGLQLHRRAILVGNASYAQDLIKDIQAATHGYDIVGTFPLDYSTAEQLENTSNEVHNDKINATTICHFMQEHKASDIILVAQNGLQPELLNCLLACYEKGISVKPIHLVYEELMSRVPVKHLRRDWFPIPPWNTSIAPIFYHISKRLLDIIVALVGLVVLLPLLPFIALVIFIESPGPIFYTQERLGKGGMPFHLIKFRSMIPNAEQGGKAIWARKGDTRITRVGQFLRLTRLDELPQVLNILKGDMSVVGPRPERPQFVNQLEQEIPFYRTRLCIKPGLTGWAQINYRYGSTVEDAITKLEYDLYYVKRQSLLLDLLIIFRTVSVVFLFKGT